MQKITLSKPVETIPTNSAAYVAPAAPAAPIAEPTPTVALVEPTPTAPISNEPATPAIPTAVVEAPKPAPATKTPKPETTNVTKITFDNVEPETTQQQPNQPAPKPKVEDLLKDVPKDELYKFLGLDEHDIKFSEFRKKGGNPYDYIKQKAVDYTKIPDEVLLKDKLKEKYPSLDDKKINVLYNDRYGQSETDDDSTNERRAIIAEADAYEVRQERIKQQQSNDIPSIAQPQQAESENDRVAKEQMNNRNMFIDYFQNSEPVKNFLSEKKLKVDLGNGKFHTFDIENPKHLLDSITNSTVAAKYGNDAQGKPDTQLMLEIALHRIAPQKYVQALLEQGRSLGLFDELLKNGQNATDNVGKAPSQPANTNRKITPTGSRITQHG